MIQAFFASTAVVALAEIGDKTQIAIVRRVSLKATRLAAALLFLVLGLWQLAELFGWLS